MTISRSNLVVSVVIILLNLLNGIFISSISAVEYAVRPPNPQKDSLEVKKDKRLRTRSFECDTSSGAPRTMIGVPGKQKKWPVIVWNSGRFTASGWSDLRRCKDVSENRFPSFYRAGILRNLSVGKSYHNGFSYDVICVLENEGDRSTADPCQNVLFTIKPGEDVYQRLELLKSVMKNPKKNGPMMETGSEDNYPVYDIDSFLRSIPALIESSSHANTPESPPNPTRETPTQPVIPLW